MRNRFVKSAGVLLLALGVPFAVQAQQASKAPATRRVNQRRRNRRMVLGATPTPREHTGPVCCSLAPLLPCPLAPKPRERV